jgi:hypothetical protein
MLFILLTRKVVNKISGKFIYHKQHIFNVLSDETQDITNIPKVSVV